MTYTQEHSPMQASNPNKPRWPVWAALRFEYDRTRALEETESLSDFFINLPPHLTTVKNYKKFWPLVPDELYNEIGYWSNLGPVTGRRPTWLGINLTTTNKADERDIISGANRVQGQSKGSWVWNVELAQHALYICSLIEQLPFEYFDVVRIMTIPVGGFGPVHIDKPEGEAEHSEKDFAALTIELSNGGVPMQIQDRGGKRHSITDKAYLFLDTVAHGIPLVSSKRVIIRTYGKIDPVRLDRMIDYKTAIW